MSCGVGLRGKRKGRALFFVLALFLDQTRLRAEGVTIESADPAQNIKVQVDKASIRDVLQALHDKYSIELALQGDVGSNALVSVTFQGNLPEILGRMLRNENYMIVRSKKNVTGVEKILIAVSDGSKGQKSVTPQRTPPPPPAIP